MNEYPSYQELMGGLTTVMWNKNLNQAQKYNIVAQALIKSFVWDATPQKWEYWNTIHQQLIALVERAAAHSPNQERIKALKNLIKDYQNEIYNLEQADKV